MFVGIGIATMGALERLTARTKAPVFELTVLYLEFSLDPVGSGGGFESHADVVVPWSLIRMIAAAASIIIVIVSEAATIDTSGLHSLKCLFALFDNGSTASVTVFSGG